MWVFFFFLRKDLEKHHVQAFLAAFPKWQGNFVFCFVTYSALTNHHAMITERFSYQTKKGHFCFANFKGKTKREFALKNNDGVSDVIMTIKSKIFHPEVAPFLVLMSTCVPPSRAVLKGSRDRSVCPWKQCLPSPQHVY